MGAFALGHSQAEKAQSRERILKEAADQIRDGGLESVSVGKLMKSVNLTHGVRVTDHAGAAAEISRQRSAAARPRRRQARPGRIPGSRQEEMSSQEFRRKEKQCP